MVVEAALRSCLHFTEHFSAQQKASASSTLATLESSDGKRGQAQPRPVDTPHTGT